MNKRRKMLAALAGACAAPGLSCAQPRQTVKRVGVLASDSFETRGASVAVFIQAMRDLGYVDRGNIVYDVRYANSDRAQLSAMAVELARQMDVIVVPNDFTVQAVSNAAEQTKRQVSIVFAGSSAPIRAGVAASLARPGGNVTGVTNFTHELAGKQLQLLRDISPAIARVAVFLDFDNVRLAPLYLAEVQAAAKALAMETLTVEVRGGEDVERNTALLRKWRADSIFVANQSRNFSNRKVLVRIAELARLPAIYGNDVYAEMGGLISYGSNDRIRWRQTATFVDKILKGARPGELPIEIPTKFDLVINLKTAKALGVTIPQSVLAQADKVIE
jgi:putative ABC transport system substrate-binding protein